MRWNSRRGGAGGAKKNGPIPPLKMKGGGDELVVFILICKFIFFPPVHPYIWFQLQLRFRSFFPISKGGRAQGGLMKII